MPNGSDQVYLVTGSNSGNSQNYLKKAILLIERIKNTKIILRRQSINPKVTVQLNKGTI